METFNNKFMNRSYFFDHGIRFECRQCGACCIGSPGYVYVNRNEIKKIAAYSGIPLEDLVRDYLRPFGGSYSIMEHRDGRCFFYDKGCAIYPVRPLQCRTFPFWIDTLRSEKKWNALRKECPGIGRGRLYNKEEILNIVGAST
jgi:uncharacterized protein